LWFICWVVTQGIKSLKRPSRCPSSPSRRNSSVLFKTPAGTKKPVPIGDTKWDAKESAVDLTIVNNTIWSVIRTEKRKTTKVKKAIDQPANLREGGVQNIVDFKK